ncbi:MAG: hypothetical protein JXQ96_07480 [Cyclobacteriaceae bacterium]
MTDHSYKLQLWHDGTNLQSIQLLLKHTSSKTSEIYSHVCSYQLSDITSLLDQLNNNGYI